MARGLTWLGRYILAAIKAARGRNPFGSEQVVLGGRPDMPDLGGSGTSTVPPTLPKSESRADLVLELRIHGVHGTPPHSMLGVTSDKVGQVRGDGITGVFRTRDGEVPLRSLRGVEPRRVAVEAYSWGNLTTNIKGIFGWLTRFLLALPSPLCPGQPRVLGTSRTGLTSRRRR